MKRQPSSTCLDLVYASAIGAFFNSCCIAVALAPHNASAAHDELIKSLIPHSFLSKSFIYCIDFLEYRFHAKAISLTLVFNFTMSFRTLCLSTFLLQFHPIFTPPTLAQSSAAGKLNLYNDYDCIQPSTLNPSVTLSLSTCLVTTGGEGLVIASLPACPSSSATLIYYQDTACGVQTNDVTTGITAQNCFQLAAGVGIYNARSVMFSCSPAANNPQPSSTTTAVVSALAAVATGNAGSGGSGSGSGSSTSSAAGSTFTDTSAQKNSTGSSGGTSNGGSGTGTSAGSGSGLGTGDIIALAVGFGVGIPSIAVAILAWRFPVFRHKLISSLPGHGASQHNEPYQLQHSGPQGMQQGMHSRQQPFHLY